MIKGCEFMKKLVSVFSVIMILCFSVITTFAQNSNLKNVLMSADGTLEANFTMDELIAAEELLIYQDDKTGYKASATIEESKDYTYRVAFRFEDGDAFFSFKTDIDYADGNAKLVGVHSKTMALPHRALTDYEYSSQPYGDIIYTESAGRYDTQVGYVTEIREFIQKGIKGQGVSLTVYENGLICIKSTVLDTDTKGGYDTRTIKEIIGSNSKKIILAVFALAFGLKHFWLDNVSRNSARLLERKKNGEQ